MFIKLRRVHDDDFYLSLSLCACNSARYWNVTLRREECVVPKSYTARDVTGCTVHFSICKPLPREICVNQTNSSTCEVVTTRDGKIHYFNVGTTNTDLQPTGTTLNQDCAIAFVGRTKDSLGSKLYRIVHIFS